MQKSGQVKVPLLHKPFFGNYRHVNEVIIGVMVVRPIVLLLMLYYYMKKARISVEYT